MWNFLLCVLVAAVPVCSAADGDSLSRSGLIQQLAERLAQLAEEGRGYLGRLAGEQTVLSVHKAFSQVLSAVAGSLATALNVVLQYVSQCTQAAGLQLSFPPDFVTVPGLIFVVQWVLVALLGYSLLSLTFRLLAAALHRAWWLLKVVAALACFAHLLREPDLSAEARAVQIGILLLVCLFFGVGTTRGPNVSEKTHQLENQLQELQERLEKIEDWRIREVKRRD